MFSAYASIISIILLDMCPAVFVLLDIPHQPDVGVCRNGGSMEFAVSLLLTPICS